MKKIKKIISKFYLLIFLIIFILGVVCNFTFSKYSQVIDGAGGASIAKPIIHIEKEDVKEMEIYKGCKQIEYNFSVSNFEGNDLTDVDFEYIISIEESNNNFPVQYSLLNDNNEEIKLENNKSEKILLTKEKETVHSYKLIAKWQDLQGELSAKDSIKINIEMNQFKK
jgi:hypothetical protein